ncbi:SDR family NAD(P)-dependent oxidoreductase [Saccharothrix xinjiangensis]|uniref:SDR family NAD(P)-dependent oxidoreductase n=1 Tax=Saccharothrix xinjiangensis TaxID=204798 RepID=A0ABV9Y9K4_9PSEU
MSTTGKAVLVTGANRGIGKALVEEALKRGAKRVYAGTRTPLVHPDERVTPVTLDVTDARHVRAAVDQVDSLDVLINNAGVFAVDDLGDPVLLDRVLAVNFHGVHNVTRAFLPKLIASGGAVATNTSVNAIAPFPLLASYAISKAAALALTQSLRSILASRGVSVHAIFSGPVDTDMGAEFDAVFTRRGGAGTGAGVKFDVAEKASPESVAHHIFEGIEKGVEDIFPDPASQNLANDWHNGSTKALERHLAAMYADFTR